jgi:hypothetical protein
MEYVKSKESRLLVKVKEAGFESIDDFVKANVDYLPIQKKNLLNTVIEMKSEFYKANESRRYFQGVCYYGKG